MPVCKRNDSPYWQIRIGRKTRFSSGTEDYDKARQIEAAERERLWKLKKLGDRGAVSFHEAAARWLTSSARAKARDRWIIGWLTERVERSDTVSDLADPDALEELRKDGLTDGWSHSTVDRMMGTVSAILHACVDWQYITVVPAIPMYRAPRDEPRWLTPNEFERLCHHLPMHLRLAARLAVATLLRMRAMLQLTWDRVDLDAARAWVPRAHQKAGRTFGLPLSSEAVRVLRALRSISLTTLPLVFTWRGAPLDDCNTLSFQKAVKAAHIEPACNWHDLRHTGASWAVQSGVTLPELMLLGDWRDYRSVLRYAHFAPSSAAAAAEKVAQWAHGAREKREPARARKSR